VTRHLHNDQHLLFISVTIQGKDHINATSAVRVLCPNHCLKLTKAHTTYQILTLLSKKQYVLSEPLLE
jgi:hypothetical protein